MKLDDINKENIHSVPDKYFDELPMRIQSRIAPKDVRKGYDLSWLFSWKTAVPAFAAVLIVVGIFIFGPDNNFGDPDKLLAQVETEDIIAYLDMTELSIDDLLEDIDPLEIDLMGIEGTYLPEEMLLDSTDIDQIIDEFVIDGDFLIEENS